MARSVYSEITPEMEALANLCVKNGKIDPELYAKYDVKRGLRDINGNGVLTGLTDISEIRSSRMENGVKIPCEGQLSTAVTALKILSAACRATTASALK